MTETYPYALPLMNVPRATSKNLSNLHSSPLARPDAPRPVRASTLAPSLPDSPADGQILLGLGALLIPVVAYSLLQTGNLISSGALDHAIRAFLP